MILLTVKTIAKIIVHITKVFLVTGGVDPNTQLISSTEVYHPSDGEWREVPGALPRPMTSVGVVTLNNRFLLFGEIIILKI